MKLRELQEKVNKYTKGEKLPSYKKLKEQNLPALLQLYIGNQELKVYNNGLATFSDFIGGKVRHTVFPIHDLKLCYEYSRSSCPAIKISDYPVLLEYEASEILKLCGMDRLDQNTYSRESHNESKLLESAKNSSKEMNISCSEDFTDALIDKIDNKERFKNLHKAIEKLTENQREVIKLYYWGELSEEKIAKKLGISRASVQDRLDGAKKKIRKYMSR